MAKRNIEIDTLRGLACILLVAYHVIGVNDVTGLRLPDDHPLRFFNACLTYLRMPVFSFLSGVVYTWRPCDGDAAGFLKGKARRLLVPMLIVGTLFALLQANVPGANHTHYEWSRLHVMPVAHYWFLESLFLCFVIVASLERIGWLQRELPLVGVMLAAVALHLANPLPREFGMLGAVYLLPYVLLGILCARLKPRQPDQTATLFAILTGVSAAALAVLQNEGFPHRNSVLALLMGAATCIGLYRLRAKSEWLAWIGLHSFAIYLFHAIFAAGSRVAMKALGNVPVSVLFLAGLAAGILCPIAAKTLIRKMPPLDFWMLGESVRARALRARVQTP